MKVKTPDVMTQEWMLKTLVNLGFKQQEAEVYVFLTLNGIQKVKDVAYAVKTTRRQVYRTIKKLQNKEIINATPNFPAQFSAVSFDQVLGLFIKANMEEANRIEEKKGEILALWKSSIKGDSEG